MSTAIIRIFSLASVSLLAIAPRALAMDTPGNGIESDELFLSEAPMSLAALSEARGGFSHGGMDFDISINIGPIEWGSNGSDRMFGDDGLFRGQLLKPRRPATSVGNNAPQRLANASPEIPVQIATPAGVDATPSATPQLTQTNQPQAGGGTTLTIAPAPSAPPASAPAAITSPQAVQTPSLALTTTPAQPASDVNTASNSLDMPAVDLVIQPTPAPADSAGQNNGSTQYGLTTTAPASNSSASTENKQYAGIDSSPATTQNSVNTTQSPTPQPTNLPSDQQVGIQPPSSTSPPYTTNNVAQSDNSDTAAQGNAPVQQADTSMQFGIRPAEAANDANANIQFDNALDGMRFRQSIDINVVVHNFDAQMNVLRASNIASTVRLNHAIFSGLR